MINFSKIFISIILISFTTIAIGRTPKAEDTSPIELLQFNAIFNEDHVELTWSSGSELNSDIFIIQKSKEGFEWEDVLVVYDVCDDVNDITYFEIDNDVHTGVSYYRLKQIDKSGTEETFNTVPVENIEKGEIAFNVFNNPTTQDNINLSFIGFQNEIVLVVMRDIEGKEHYSKVTIIENEDELQIITIDNSLPKGIYLVTASSANELYSQKVVIK